VEEQNLHATAVIVESCACSAGAMNESENDKTCINYMIPVHAPNIRHHGAKGRTPCPAYLDNASMMVC